MVPDGESFVAWGPLAGPPSVWHGRRRETRVITVDEVQKGFGGRSTLDGTRFFFGEPGSIGFEYRQDTPS
jgi:hypothetical protein